MTKEKLALLKKLLMTPSPSGFEQSLVYSIREYLRKLVPSNVTLEIDFHNNLIVTIPGKDWTKFRTQGKTIVIDAHADQLGFMVNNIDKDGFISLMQIGGGTDINLAVARKAFVLTEKHGIVNGAISVKPIHLIYEADEALPEKTTDLVLDLGVRHRGNVIKIVSPGDPVILAPDFDKLQGSNYIGSGFDDKIGCFILINLIEQLADKTPDCNLKFVFSSQEEIGCLGSSEVARRLQPDLFVGIDVTHATDYPSIDEKEAGRCILGEGCVIHKGVNIFRPMNNNLMKVARRNKIKFQILATDSTGTNAGVVSHVGGGVRILDIGIPLRNMHSAVEIVNETDVANTTKLLKAFLLDKNTIKILNK